MIVKVIKQIAAQIWRVIGAQVGLGLPSLSIIVRYGYEIQDDRTPIDIDIGCSH